MLIIREEQYEAFRQQARQRFRKKMLGHLRLLFAKEWEKKSDAEILGFIDQGVEKSLVYGLRTEYAIQRVLELMCEVSCGFDDPDWVKKILNSSALKERHKVDLIGDSYKAG